MPFGVPSLTKRFNGAATARSRNCGKTACPRCGSRASMGPRPRGRGIVSEDARYIARHIGFNGAATARSRNWETRLRDILRRIPLQWGRDRAVAELRNLASMSPGETCFNGAATARSRNFNHWCLHRHPPRGFNGAATARSRNLSIEASSVSSCTASMGPRPRGRGIGNRGTAHAAESRASMGPRPRGRGIALYFGCKAGIGLLQWGRDRAVAELPPS